jgi:hypothetical protein
MDSLPYCIDEVSEQARRDWATSIEPIIALPVHYSVPGPGIGDRPVCRAAVVTHLIGHTGNVGLAVLAPEAISFHLDVPHDETQRPRTWHHPHDPEDHGDGEEPYLNERRHGDLVQEVGD